MRMEVRPRVAESRARMMLLSVIESSEDVASSNTLKDDLQGDNGDQLLNLVDISYLYRVSPSARGLNFEAMVPPSAQFCQG